jgi:hypothetical protein
MVQRRKAASLLAKPKDLSIERAYPSKMRALARHHFSRSFISPMALVRRLRCVCPDDRKILWFATNGTGLECIAKPLANPTLLDGTRRGHP